jgi:hypothetical protein
MAIRPKSETRHDLTPEQWAKAEAIASKWHTPEARADEIRAREALAAEYQRNGTIATAGEAVAPSDLVQFRRLAGRLREHRERSGLSLVVAVERSGIDEATLVRLEEGRISNLTVATLLRYARAIGVRLDWEIAESPITGDKTPELEPATD